MIKVIVVSDSHGNRRALDGLDRIFSESDMIIHLGDTSSDGGYIANKYPSKTVVIEGNCDVISVGEREKVINCEGVNIFCCHGHTYSVKSTLLRLAGRAKELGCKIALYGHTHDAKESEIDGITLLNPGTLSRYSQNSYLYLVINGENFTQKIVRIN